VYYDENLDGNNRYMALVRLTFLYFNYRQYDRLLTRFEHYDGMLRQGTYYSRRLLINYYNNRLLIHNYLGEFEKAIGYGYLSIREKNADHIHYVNTLSGVLLRHGRAEEALRVLRAAYSMLKEVSSFHNRLLFVTFYLQALQANNLSKNAENYAETFLRAYSEHIFDHRWRLFFRVFFDICLERNRTGRIVRLARKYQLLRREEEYLQRSGGHPYLRWQYTLAAYQEIRVTRAQLEEVLSTLPEEDEPTASDGMQAFLEHLRRLAPEVYHRRLRPG
jgi:tetratricopeptide (TPR) repeat protein